MFRDDLEMDDRPLQMDDFPEDDLQIVGIVIDTGKATLYDLGNGYGQWIPNSIVTRVTNQKVYFYDCITLSKPVKLRT